MTEEGRLERKQLPTTRSTEEKFEKIPESTCVKVPDVLQGWERMLGSAQSPGGSFWAQPARFQDAVSPHFLHRFPAAPHLLDLTSGGVS